MDKRVLLIEDEPGLVMTLTDRLTSENYAVTSARDGEAGEQRASQESFDIIVLDVMLPGLSGWEVAKTLRDDPETESIKIVMLTAIGAHLNDMTSPLYGADAHLDKPFEFVALEGTIARLLS